MLNDIRIRMKQPLVAFIVLFSFLLALMPALSACAPEKKSDEQLLRETLDEELYAFKKPDTPERELFAQMSDVDQLDQLGVDVPTFLNDYFSDFDYEILSIDMRPNQATAKVKLTVKSFERIESSLERQISDHEKSTNKMKMKESDAKKSFGKFVLDAVSEAPLADAGTIEISFNKNGNKWEPAPDALDKLVDALLNC